MELIVAILALAATSVAALYTVHKSMKVSHIETMARQDYDLYRVKVESDLRTMQIVDANRDRLHQQKMMQRNAEVQYDPSNENSPLGRRQSLESELGLRSEQEPEPYLREHAAWGGDGAMEEFFGNDGI